MLLNKTLVLRVAQAKNYKGEGSKNRYILYTYIMQIQYKSENNTNQ